MMGRRSARRSARRPRRSARRSGPPLDVLAKFLLPTYLLEYWSARASEKRVPVDPPLDVFAKFLLPTYLLENWSARASEEKRVPVDEPLLR